MKLFFKAAIVTVVAVAVVLYVQHQLVSGKHIDDPTYDIWK